MLAVSLDMTTSLRPFIFLVSFAFALGLLYVAMVILVPIALAVLLAFVLRAAPDYHAGH